MTEKNNTPLGAGIGNWILKDKVTLFISYIVWCLIYKVIDMNTMQWFGKGMFITEGEVWEFFVMAIFAFFVIAWVIGLIHSFFTGKW